MIRFHDPRGEVAVETTEYTLSKEIRDNDGEGVTVALLANGFPDSDNFIKAVGEAIRGRLPNIRTMFWDKGNASIPANDEILGEIEAHCQVAIAAYGH